MSNVGMNNKTGQPTPSGAEALLAKNGVYADHHGLRGLAEASEFWARQMYGTRLYYGEGGCDYLHRGILQTAVMILDNTAERISTIERMLAESLANLDNAEQRIREFDSCIQKVAGALGACCGGVDGDQTEAGATTRVLLEKIAALKAGLVAAQEPACVCGNQTSLGIVHRTDGPCFIYQNISKPAGYNIVSCKICGITLHDEAAKSGYCSDHARGVFMTYI